MNRSHRPSVLLFAFLFTFVATLAACGGGSSGTSSTTTTTTGGFVYPAFIDSDGDNINDYLQTSTHTPATALTMGIAAADHPFVDTDGDGICDYAQNGSATWHGPGYVDNDGDGVCDYWQEGSPQYGQGGGMTWQDRNQNQVNDAMERQWHQGGDHDFVDLDGDGICDYAQNGETSSWHGDNFTDANGDGVCDAWATGGAGNGGSMGSAGMPHGGAGGHGNGPNA